MTVSPLWRLRAALSGVLALAALLTCLAVPAQAAPAAQVRVTGRVVDAEGRPYAGALVRTQNETSLLSGLAIAFSLGLLCVADSDLCFPREAVARTDASGRFSLAWADGSALQNRSRKTLTVQGGGGRDGARLGLSTLYSYGGRATSLGDLRLHDPAVSVTRLAGRKALVHVDPVPSHYGERRAVGAGLVDAAGRTTWAYIPLDERGNGVIDDRIVERGTKGVIAYGTVRPKDRLQQYLTSQPHPAGPAALPVSRGASCARYAFDGRLIPLPRCAFTDGDLTRGIPFFERLPGCDAPTEASDRGCPGSLRIDLGRQVAVEMVAVRGCWFDCAVEVSGDGRTWSRFAESDRFGDHALSGFARDVRYVRLRGSTFVLRELSVFEATSLVAVPAVPAAAGPAPVDVPSPAAKVPGAVVPVPGVLPLPLPARPVAPAVPGGLDRPGVEMPLPR